MKNAKKVAIGLMASMMLVSGQPAFAESISSLKSKYSDAASERDKHKKELAAIEKDIVKVENRLIELQSQIRETNALIKNTESKIKETNEAIEVTTRNLEIMRADLEEKKKKLEENVVFMYQRGEVGFMEFIFRSENLSEFFYRFDFLNDIMNKGETLHNEIKAQVELIELEEKKLKTQKENLETQKAELEKQQSINKQAVAESEALKQKSHAEHEHAENEQAEAQEVLNGLAAQIQEAERRYSQPTNNTSRPRSSQGLVSPMNRYYVTSEYGYRYHPIRGTRHLHSGIDLAYRNGEPIYAAGDGVVLFAGPANGYGNWVVIKHDNGLYTIYGHMYRSTIKVSPGQRVSQGQHIAAVGSAGDSTGPHLHLCVATSFSGGKFAYTNPRNYINF